MDNKKLLLLLLLLLLLSLLLVSVSKTAHYSFKKGKKSKDFSDVRLEACTLEYYPGQLKRQSRTHHMAVISSGITLYLVI